MYSLACACGLASDGYSTVASAFSWGRELGSRRAKPTVGIQKKEERGIARRFFAFLRFSCVSKQDEAITTSQHDMRSSLVSLVLQARGEQNNFPVQT